MYAGKKRGHSARKRRGFPAAPGKVTPLPGAARSGRLPSSPAGRRVFAGWLACVCAAHLGLVLLAFVHRLNIWLFPAAAAGPYTAATIELILALPGIFIFDLGLVTLVFWLLERCRTNAPAPWRFRASPPGRRGAFIALACLVLLFLLINLGRDHLLRLWSPDRRHAYSLLGPGFIRGLPLLNSLLGIAAAARLALFLIRREVWRGAILCAADLACLVGTGLFFALPKLLILPPFLAAPAGLGDTIAKILAAPILLWLAVTAARRVLALCRPERE